MGIFMKKVYPIVITPDDQSGYIVYVPDLEINTQGETIAECIEMARDAIGIWGTCHEDEGETIPQPSTEYPKHQPNEVVTLVDIDFGAYRRSLDMKAVRTNVTIPRWLKEKADKEQINYSAVLQQGLKNELGVNDRP